MKDLLSSFLCVTYVCDKRFMLSLMFVDYAVEPFYFDMKGPDLYSDGANYGMASLLHMAGLMAPGPYRVEHDQSKNLTTYHEMIEWFIGH